MPEAFSVPAIVADLAVAIWPTPPPQTAIDAAVADGEAASRISGGLYGAVVSAVRDSLGRSLSASELAGVLDLVFARGTPAGRALEDRFADIVNAKDFGIIGDGATDNTAAMLIMRNWLKAQAKPPCVVWSAGIYLYAQSPNWNIDGLKMIGIGDVRLRYTGGGEAFIINDNEPIGIFDQEIGPFIIEAPSTALNGVYLRSVHHGLYRFNVRGCGTNYAGIRLDFGVANVFDRFVCSNNQNDGAQGWYLGAKPQIGIYLDRHDTFLEPAAYNLFIAPIVEGTVVGAFCGYAIGNQFLGGTLEGCTDQGLLVSAFAKWIKAIGVDFEANGGQDVYIAGAENEILYCDTLREILITGAAAIGNFVVGGTHGALTFAAGAAGNALLGARYNRHDKLGAGAVTDTLHANRTRDLYNVLTNKWHHAVPYVEVPAVGASPFVYTNTSPNPVRAVVAGGTVSSIVYGRTGGALNIGTDGQVTLSPDDTLTITYTVAPTLGIWSE